MQKIRVIVQPVSRDVGVLLPQLRPHQQRGERVLVHGTTKDLRADCRHFGVGERRTRNMDAAEMLETLTAANVGHTPDIVTAAFGLVPDGVFVRDLAEPGAPIPDVSMATHNNAWLRALHARRVAGGLVHRRVAAVPARVSAELPAQVGYLPHSPFTRPER